MNHQPQDNRRRAERKFAHALDELETVLQSEPSETTEPPPDSPPPPQRRPARPQHPEQGLDETADLGALLDDAVQDIEQFMAAKQPAPDDQ